MSEKEIENFERQIKKFAENAEQSALSKVLEKHPEYKEYFVHQCGCFLSDKYKEKLYNKKKELFELAKQGKLISSDKTFEQFINQ